VVKLCHGESTAHLRYRRFPRCILLLALQNRRSFRMEAEAPTWIVQGSAPGAHCSDRLCTCCSPPVCEYRHPMDFSSCPTALIRTGASPTKRTEAVSTNLVFVFRFRLLFRLGPLNLVVSLRCSKLRKGPVAAKIACMYYESSLEESAGGFVGVLALSLPRFELSTSAEEEFCTVVWPRGTKTRHKSILDLSSIK